MKKIHYQLLLIVIVLMLFLVNYTPGTWLSGWDTLHPEFNWPLYFQRTIFASWQETYGLGAISIQSYASEFSRLLLLFPLSLILPSNFLRYFYLLLTLLAGTIGTFLFLRNISLKNIPAFLGSLVYLLNLGTLQIFSLPFEMNITHFATYPWLLLSVTKYIKHNSLSNLLFVALAAFFTSSTAHTPTLFFIILTVVLLYSISIILLTKMKLINLVIILYVILIVNAFWLLPTGYTLLTHTSVVTDSKVSQEFSNDLMLNEQNVGTLQNTVMLKNIFFDWGRFSNNERSFVQILEQWENHEKNGFTVSIGYSIFTLVVIGGLISIKHNKFSLALLPGFVIGFVFLANGEPVFQRIISLFIDWQPFLRESLRFTLTKFMVITAFAYAVYFSVTIDFILIRFSKKFLSLIILVTISGCLIFYMIPAFKGNFLNDKVKVSFPQEYFSAAGWVNGHTGLGRVALFPEESFWAWHYYKWNYEGAGFWWFLLDKPVLDREAGRWMPQNENYYWEVSYALYSKNLPLFEKVLEKYDVSWLLVDKNIISPTSPKSLFFDELKELIGESQNIKLAKSFGSIDIYSFNVRDNFVYVLRDPPSINKYQWGNLDQAYVDYGTYISGDYPDVIYSYRTLFTGKDQKDLEFKIDPNTLKDPIYQTKNLTSWLPNLEHKKAYLIEIKAKSLAGKPFLFWIENHTNRKSDLETYLPDNPAEGTYYFVQPPMASDGLGYTLHLDNISIGKTIAKNELTQLSVYEFPYNNLVSKKIIKPGASPKPAEILPVAAVFHPNPAFYAIQLVNTAPDDVLVLAQSFDTGWLTISQTKTNHILVSNWANGWQLAGGEKIVYLFYWPQLLEFLGFLLLAGFIVWYIINIKHGGRSSMVERQLVELNVAGSNPVDHP